MQNNRLLLEKYEQVQVNRVLQDSFQRDLTAFEQYLIQEGLWDTIKQKGSQLVGGAKNALLQPLVKMVLDKIAQSDPEGFKQLQAAAQDPQKLQALLNSPEIQQQQQAISQDVATTTESIDEELYELYLNEAYGHLVPEAWVDPKTGRFVKAGTPGAVERKGASQRDARGRFVKGATPPATQEPPVIQGPGAFLNPGQHGSTAAYAAAQGKKVAQRIPQQTLGQKIAGTADKAAIAGLKGLGKASNLIGKGAQALGQSKLGQAAGGFVGKAVNWIKKNPKISLAAGLALLAATGGAAAIGAGGIAPLITSTLSAGAAGATKGGIAGAAFGGIKNLAQQAQDAKSLKDINWKQAGKEALKKGAVGAAIGGAVGAGANVLGKAAAGVGKVINRYQAGTSGGGVGTTAPTSQASNQGPDFGANDGAQVVQAKQKVVQNTVEWIKNNNSLDIDDKMEHLKNVLGSHGQGADEQYTYALLNAYKRGQVSDETLAKWFTKLARNNTLTAQVVAVQAKQEAAQKALEWIQNNSGTPMSAKLNGIEKILGTAGRGADKSYLTQLLYAQGRGVPGSDETLLKWLNHLASQ